MQINYNTDVEFNSLINNNFDYNDLIENNDIVRISKKSNDLSFDVEQIKFQNELTRIALQMAHDIASPVAALDIIQSSTSLLPEDTRELVKNITSRIRDITQTFLKTVKYTSKLTESHDSRQSLYSLINHVIAEKRVQYADNVNIRLYKIAEYQDLYSKINPIEFSRLFSNIINNSIEAITDDNRIIIYLRYIGDEIGIQIQDFGKGIPYSVLSQLGKLGASFGKVQGNGIGLNHAINSINKWGGRFEIKSRENQGTLIQIFLPRHQLDNE